MARIFIAIIFCIQTYLLIKNYVKFSESQHILSVVKSSGMSAIDKKESMGFLKYLSWATVVESALLMVCLLLSIGAFVLAFKNNTKNKI